MFPACLRDKIAIQEYLKHNNIQHYLVPDWKIPIKFIIRGLPRSTDTKLMKETLSCRGFDIFKDFLLKCSRDEKLQILFLREITKNENSNKIYNFRPVSSLE